MHKISKEERLRNTVCKGLEHLHDKLGYHQSNIVHKLKMLDRAVSTASLSNIKNGKSVGLSALTAAAKGMEALLHQELDMGFDVEKQDFVPLHTSGWITLVVPEKPAQDTGAAAFILHADGRVPLQKKTDFITDAKREVIEVGIRLNSFSHYFISQNEMAYKAHIVSALRRGVHIKGYLLDPNSSEALVYFNDRALVQSFEKESIADIKKVIDRFKGICADLEALQLPGKFEIYLYKHIPYNLFLVVDGATDFGKMMVSPYLYGIRRANCPVFEFTKKDQPLLFRKYWESMQLFLDGARKLY